METPRFTWDPRKDAANRRKHGVSFAEAVGVFHDDDALLIDDPEHSLGEERFVLLGRSRDRRVLVVVHCYRSAEAEIRIISARSATRPEARYYLIGGR
jgi:uncharacterized DUF497 family protein